MINYESILSLLKVENSLKGSLDLIPSSLKIRTSKSLSEALLLAEHGENMLCTKIVLNVRSIFCTQQGFSVTRFD